MKIYLGDDALTLSGKQFKVGDQLNSITICKEGSFKEETINFQKGKLTVLATYPSVDTSVCDLQVLGMSKLTKEYPNVEFVGVSVDLPCALSAYKSMHPTGDIVMCSDYKNKEVGKKLGLVIDELQLLGRSVFVLDENNKVIYTEIKEQIAEQINFEALKAVLNR